MLRGPYHVLPLSGTQHDVNWQVTDPVIEKVCTGSHRSGQLQDTSVKNTTLVRVLREGRWETFA